MSAEATERPSEEQAEASYDLHSMIREHQLVMTAADGTVTRYVPREEWEKTETERGNLRRVLAFISAWRIEAGVHDPDLDRFLASVGETRDQGHAVASVLAGLREDLTTLGATR